jgi:hypothetical protein
MYSCEVDKGRTSSFAEKYCRKSKRKSLHIYTFWVGGEVEKSTYLAVDIYNYEDNGPDHDYAISLLENLGNKVHFNLSDADM